MLNSRNMKDYVKQKQKTRLVHGIHIEFAVTSYLVGGAERVKLLA